MGKVRHWIFLLVFTMLISLLSGCVSTSPYQKVEKLRKDFENTRDIQPLTNALEDEDVNVRKEAALTLGKTRDPRSVDPLIAALKDNNSDVRATAAWALGAIKDLRSVEPLIALLKDNDSGVREYTTWALGEIKDPKAVEPLLNTLKDNHKIVRARAALALGKIGDTRGLVPLATALKDEESKVREDAALALGKIGDTRAVGPLIEALKDEDHWYIHLSALDLWKKKHPNWRAIRVPIHEMPACSSARANFRYPKAGYQIFATFPRLGGKMPIDMVFPLNENKPRLSSDGVLEGTYYYFFRVRYAAAESLRNITGQDYGEDYKKWQKWYLGKEND